MTAEEYQDHTVITAPQALTGAFVNLGSPIKMLGWDEMAVYTKVTDNDSTAIQMAVYGLIREGGGEYMLPIANIGETKTTLKHLIYEFSETNADMLYRIRVRGIPWIQLKVKGTGNAPTPGTIDSCIVYCTARL